MKDGEEVEPDTYVSLVLLGICGSVWFR